MSDVSMTDTELASEAGGGYDMTDAELATEADGGSAMTDTELAGSDGLYEGELYEGEVSDAEGEADGTYCGADAAADATEAAPSTDGGEIDYAALVEADLMALGGEFSEMRGAESITELKNPLRYAALRDLGLSPREAYLATGGRKRAHDTRGHLSSAVPKGAGAPRGTMSRGELERARELFPGLGDRELMGLYRKVSV